MARGTTDRELAMRALFPAGDDSLPAVVEDELASPLQIGKSTRKQKKR
jgi:hypothetical protein